MATLTASRAQDISPEGSMSRSSSRHSQVPSSSPPPLASGGGEEEDIADGLPQWKRDLFEKKRALMLHQQEQKQKQQALRNDVRTSKISPGHVADISGDDSDDASSTSSSTGAGRSGGYSFVTGERINGNESDTVSSEDLGESTVTPGVQQIVNDSALLLDSSSASELDGYYTPGESGAEEISYKPGFVNQLLNKWSKISYHGPDTQSVGSQKETSREAHAIDSLDNAINSALQPDKPIQPVTIPEHSKSTIQRSTNDRLETGATRSDTDMAALHYAARAPDEIILIESPRDEQLGVQDVLRESTLSASDKSVQMKPKIVDSARNIFENRVSAPAAPPRKKKLSPRSSSTDTQQQQPAMSVAAEQVTSAADPGRNPDSKTAASHGVGNHIRLPPQKTSAPLFTSIKLKRTGVSLEEPTYQEPVAHVNSASVSDNIRLNSNSDTSTSEIELPRYDEPRKVVIAVKKPFVKKLEPQPSEDAKPLNKVKVTNGADFKHSDVDSDKKNQRKTTNDHLTTTVSQIPSPARPTSSQTKFYGKASKDVKISALINERKSVELIEQRQSTTKPAEPAKAIFADQTVDAQKKPSWAQHKLKPAPKPPTNIPSTSPSINSKQPVNNSTNEENSKSNAIVGHSKSVQSIDISSSVEIIPQSRQPSEAVAVNSSSSSNKLITASSAPDIVSHSNGETKKPMVVKKGPPALKSVPANNDVPKKSDESSNESSDLAAVLKRRKADSAPVTNIDDILAPGRGSGSRVFDTRKSMGNKRKVPEYEKIHDGPAVDFDSTPVVIDGGILKQSTGIKKNLSFNDANMALVHEYPSERCMVQNIPKEHGAVYYDDPDYKQGGADDDEIQVIPISKGILGGNTSASIASGSLGSHRSSLVSDYSFGQHVNGPEKDVVLRDYQEESTPEKHTEFIKPANESDVGAWSSSGSSDMLF